MIIYQVFTRLFGSNAEAPVKSGSKEESGCGKMSDFDSKALEQIRSLGATHIWYTGIIEHATQTDYSSFGIRKDNRTVVKGMAGSPYAIKDYFDIDPDLADDVANRMEEFHALVKRSHAAGLKVIIDFVPNHVARQYCSDVCPEGITDLGAEDDTTKVFDPQNNFYYIPEDSLHLGNITSDTSYREYPAKATGNDNFSSWPSRNDWYETIKLNYGVDICGGRQGHFWPIPSTWNKMLQILLFWAGKEIDGFRCDMAEMVPVEFWEWAIPQVKEAHPDIVFVAEVYNPHEYRNYIHRGHFDYLYDKVGLYDTLKAVSQGNCSSQNISGCWQSVDDIQQHMLNFLENHDEQRIASDFFVGDARKGKAPLLVSALMHGNPTMIYFGQELGERGMDEEGFSGRDGRTTIFDYWTVDSIRRWRDGGRFSGKKLTNSEVELQDFYTKVLHIKELDLFAEGQFFDVMYANSHLHQQYVFLRKQGREVALVVANFSIQDQDVSIGLPKHLFDFWKLRSVKQKQVTDLLTDRSMKIPFAPDEALNIHLDALGGVVLLMKV